MIRLSTVVVFASVGLALAGTSAAARDGFSAGGRGGFRAAVGPGGGFHRPSFGVRRHLSRPFYPSWFKVARNPFPGFHRRFAGFDRSGFKFARGPFGGFHRPFAPYRLPYWPVQLDSGSPVVTVVLNQVLAPPGVVPSLPSVRDLPVSAGLRETRPAPATVIVINERTRGSSDTGTLRLSRGPRIVKAVPDEADAPERDEPPTLGARVVYVSVPAGR